MDYVQDTLVQGDFGAIGDVSTVLVHDSRREDGRMDVTKLAETDQVFCSSEVLEHSVYIHGDIYLSFRSGSNLSCGHELNHYWP